MTQKLFPIIEQAPPGSITPELMGVLQAAIEHYAGHIKQAEAKGAAGQTTGPFKKAMNQAVKHLTAGQVQNIPTDVMPAANAPIVGRRGPSMPEFGGNFKEPSQPGIVQSVATPPKPPTAG
jgi:hypothetical protein